jgi:aminopeptidase C
MDKKALEEEIRMVAYELYIKNGYVPGRDLENWLEAERIVLAKYGLTSKEMTQESSLSSNSEEKPKLKTRCRKKAKEGATKGKVKGKSKKKG